MKGGEGPKNGLWFQDRMLVRATRSTEKSPQNIGRFVKAYLISKNMAEHVPTAEPAESDIDVRSSK